MIILDAFEVKIVREVDGEEIILDKKVEWDIISYTSELIQLQLKIENPEDLSPQLNINDFISVTFWGADYFENEAGVGAEFGLEIRSKRVQRQIDTDSADIIEEMGETVSGVLLATIIFAFLMSLILGRALPFWVYLNSLQLVVYTPLVTANMPSNLHYFLNDYLQLVRLNQIGIFKYAQEHLQDLE